MCTFSMLHDMGCHACWLQASLGWRRPISIQQIRWGGQGSQDRQPLVEVASVKSSVPLWDMTRGCDFDLIVQSPRVDGGVDTDGVLRLQAAAQV